MVRHLLIALLLAGCYSPSLTDCAVECAPGDECPSGLTCSAGFCRVAGAAGSCGPLPDAPAADAFAADAPIDASPLVDASPSCGNGDVDKNEDCDDANLVSSDACRNDCRWNLCGDGVQRTGVEECDDGNTANGDGCSENCLICGTGIGVNASLFNGTTKHCYRRSDNATNKLGASVVCLIHGSYPATFLANDAERTFLLDFLPGATASYWVGATHVANANWIWPTGDAFTAGSALWATGEPDTDATDDDPLFPSAVLLKSAATSGLDDQLDATPFGIVCEQDGFTFGPDRHGYLMIPEGLDWATAKSRCADLSPGRSHLVTIDSVAERELVKTVAWKTVVWVGGADDDALVPGSAEDAFRWLNGTAVDNGVVQWAGGAPNPGADTEDCLALQTAAFTLNDLACAGPATALCEVE